MAQTAADRVQEDVIAQDVQLARVDAGMQKRIDARLDELGRELKRLTLDVDVAGTLRRDAQVRRMNRLSKESRELIREAYSDINLMTRKALTTVAKAQSMAMATSLEESIPEELS